MEGLEVFEELKAINKQIDEWEAKIAEGAEDIVDGFMDSLYAIKKNLERQYQKFQMENELNDRIQQHISQKREQLRESGNKLSGSFLGGSIQLNMDIAKNYEAASSEKVEENFGKINHDMWLLNEGFNLVVSTCTKKGFSFF